MQGPTVGSYGPGVHRRLSGVLLRVQRLMYALASCLALQCRGSCRGDKGWLCWGAWINPEDRTRTHTEPKSAVPCSGSAATEQALCKTVIATKTIDWAIVLDCVIREGFTEERFSERKEKAFEREERGPARLACIAASLGSCRGTSHIRNRTPV